MSNTTKERDEARAALQAFAITPPSEQAVANILRAARENPREVWPWLKALRHIRAFFYIPQMRYVVMASMVGFFIMVGLFAQTTNHNAPPSKQPVTLATTATSNDDTLLFDVKFDFETQIDNEWIAGI